MLSIDLDAVRNDTPGCAAVAHLNNAGAALPPRMVVDDMIDYLRLEEVLGGYETAEREARRLDRLYHAGATLLGCQPGELALTTNASEAWWRALSAVPLEPGDRVLTGQAEYVSNALGLIQARERGIDVDVVPDDDDGQIDLDLLATAAEDERVKLIALTHVPTNSGLVNPAEEVGAIAKRTGCYFLLDACQSVGQMSVDVNTLQCDFLSLTGRKFLRAPRGTGLLYVRACILDELRPPEFIDGHSASWNAANGYVLDATARRFELFESSPAAKSGLATAIDYALALGIDAIEARVTLLARHLRSQLRSLPGVEVLDRGRRLCGIVTFTVKGHDPSDIRAAAAKAGVNVTVATTSPWQSNGGTLRSTVRASPHYYNTEAELDRLCTVVAGLG
ncbi:MAG: aminotransferase class V-fold PLP-dependent enzyme [Acidimicrobiales bacterium]